MGDWVCELTLLKQRNHADGRIEVEVGKEAELSGVIEVNEEQIRSRLHEVVRGTVEETLIEMYIAGVSVRRVDDITEALWGTRVSASTGSQR